MENKQRDQEAMNPMKINMGPPPLNNLRGYQYFIPDMQSMQNYPHMNMFNNIQPMNGYPYPIEMNKEDPSMNPPSTPENKNTQKNQNSNSSVGEKQKVKPYINLLINTVTNLMKEGKVTMKYLKEKTDHKSNHINNNINKNNSSSSSPSLPTAISYKKPNNEKINQNNIHENGQCENLLCKYIFNSNKDKYKTKIKGLKPQEKNLCKKCCEAVDKGHFCYYCNAIYRDDLTDAAKWVQCDFCNNWEHCDCELLKGKRYSSVQEINELKHYTCPICTNKKNGEKNMDSKIQKKLINKKRRGDLFDDQKCKKNQRKDLRNLKSEKCSELLEDMELIDSFMNGK